MSQETYHASAPPISRTDPARHAAAVTPADGSDLNFTSRGVYVGGSGDLKVTMADGTTLTFSAVPTGTTLAICVSRIWATGTSATGINALW